MAAFQFRSAMNSISSCRLSHCQTYLAGQWRLSSVTSPAVLASSLTPAPLWLWTPTQKKQNRPWKIKHLLLTYFFGNISSNSYQNWSTQNYVEVIASQTYKLFWDTQNVIQRLKFLAPQWIKQVKIIHTLEQGDILPLTAWWWVVCVTQNVTVAHISVFFLRSLTLSSMRSERKNDRN